MSRNNDPRCGAAGGEQKDNSSELGLGGSTCRADGCRELARQERVYFEIRPGRRYKNAHRRGSGGSPDRSSHATDEDELPVEA